MNCANQTFFEHCAHYLLYLWPHGLQSACSLAKTPQASIGHSGLEKLSYKTANRKYSSVSNDNLTLEYKGFFRQFSYIAI